MVCFSCAAKEYAYHPDERKMLVVDGFRFVVLFDVDKNCRSVNTNTLYMEFDTLTEALEIFDDRTILKPVNERHGTPNNWIDRDYDYR